MNILSVDFDIIMAPDINLYNNLVNNEKTIDDLIKEHILLNGIKVDLEHYKKLTLYLFNLIETLSENDIRISYNHEDIKFLLDGLENVKIFNIDHHHDLGYSEKPIGDCGCANWGEYYLNKGIISNFTWIKNVNSIEKMNLKE